MVKALHREAFDFLGAQFFDQIGGLLERHVAIVVAIEQQQQAIASSRYFEVLNLSNATRL